MRILFLSSWFPYPLDAGSRIRAYHLVRALARSHSVEVVAFAPPGGEDRLPSTIPALGDTRLHAVRADPFRFAKWHPLLRSASPIPVTFWPRRAMLSVLRRMATGVRWDAVVSFHVPVAQYAFLFPRVARLADVDTGLSYRMRERHRGQTGRLARWRTWVSWQKASICERAVLVRHHACTVASPQELVHTRAFLKGSRCEIALCANGVDCSEVRPSEAPRRSKALIYNGSLRYGANYEAVAHFLSEIYPLIRRQMPDVSFTVTGAVDGVDVESLALDESVHFSGRVEDIHALVGHSSVCVAPILSGGGTRIKILEAMAVGTPVVATRKGIEGLDLEQSTAVLVADDPPAFASHVVRLLQDPDLRIAVSRSARQCVEDRFDWGEIGQRFLHLVERTVHRVRLAS